MQMTHWVYRSQNLKPALGVAWGWISVQKMVLRGDSCLPSDPSANHTMVPVDPD